MPSDKSPDDVVLQFVERLPTTIRDVILARFCMAFGRLQPAANQDLSATFRSILLMPGCEGRAYACARVVAVLELVLHEDSVCIQAALARELAETTGFRRFSSIDLGAPLPQKHWQHAREEFLALRRTSLSVDSLSRLLARSRSEPARFRAT